ncbi:hypothetical protein BLNAU_425 [Blattamonas nauphoetae]|uniref:Uncharacterized protein n=1 Tax=Blattamonas nauphoetae TaxID=2049346 RepID=A0ABQ9YL84_9EUKA|nr:hypothetical protein BLNAU_425 [Blattamonas nauphoetae]
MTLNDEDIENYNVPVPLSVSELQVVSQLIDELVSLKLTLSQEASSTIDSLRTLRSKLDERNTNDDIDPDLISSLTKAQEKTHELEEELRALEEEDKLLHNQTEISQDDPEQQVSENERKLDQDIHDIQRRSHHLTREIKKKKKDLDKRRKRITTITESILMVTEGINLPEVPFQSPNSPPLSPASRSSPSSFCVQTPPVFSQLSPIPEPGIDAF